ncbi:hypothetical protein [Mangrovitalea sediminis]|uniref:hypothetical protein n=1 Tax=Mangrovitalea sediminis TaxID=1982043 RepID=UPI000BE4D024|nr:hypothetical protein [Mangrovitalea sediminis]
MFESHPVKALFIIFVVIHFMTMAICHIGFARLSMARIEREMRQDGLPRPAHWDTMGLRVHWYASAIAFNSQRMNRADKLFIDVEAIRRYATPFDRKLSIAFLISGYSFCVVGLVGAWLLGL